MFVWVVPLLASLFTLLWTPSAHACKCAAEPSPSEARDSAAAVFEGRVTQITAVATGDLVVSLNVVRGWKNAGSEQISVRTRSEGPACGFSFEPDQSYLVYAQASEKDAALPGLSVSRCSRTRLITEANADLVALGMGSAPVSTSIRDTADYDAPAPANGSNTVATQQNKPAAGGCASCSLATGTSQRPGTLSLGLGLLGVLLLLWRSRRSPR
ncbi:MAG: hypothetical protein RL701_655 [Pseudomonadota bacterium]|jgi:MYXO-CTERM domain-containing protein